MNENNRWHIVWGHADVNVTTHAVAHAPIQNDAPEHASPKPTRGAAAEWSEARATALFISSQLVE